MSLRGKSALFSFVLTVVSGVPAFAADALSELGKFSTFEQFDLGKVSGGKVVSARGPALDHARDLSIQFVYLVPGALAKVVEAHRMWDPSRHSELKVIVHGDVGAKPSAGDFGALAKPPGGGAVKALVNASQKLPNKDGLQLSTAEAQAFVKGGGLTGWGPLLAQRAAGFSSRGLAGLPPYEAGKETIRPADEVARLLKEQPKIRAQFSGLVAATPLGGGSGSAGQLYWEMFDVDGMGALSLGASYAKDGAESAQLLDLQYYASGGYYVYFSLYQMWQISVDGKPATLVWRGDSIASQSLGELRGVEKMGSGAAMMAEVKKAVTLFLKDTGK